MSPPSQKNFSAHDISFERNTSPLFEKINLSLNAGELLQLRGANGSGKSTLLRMLAGFIEPHQGRICWQGTAIHALDDYQQRIQYLGHQNGTKPYLSVQENLQLSGALSGKSFSATELQAALSRVGLNNLNHRPAAQLSAGQARRLSLARLVLQPADLWLLDEPTTALDAAGQALLAELLREHLRQNGIAIIATHHDLMYVPQSQTLWLGEQHG